MDRVVASVHAERALPVGRVYPRGRAWEEVSGIKKGYEAPKVIDLGQFPVLTLQSLDKIGSSPDFLTSLIPQLDGSIVPD
jgi:hypothetical protein